jgi:hypothetical protein
MSRTRSGHSDAHFNMPVAPKTLSAIFFDLDGTLVSAFENAPYDSSSVSPMRYGLYLCSCFRRPRRCLRSQEAKVYPCIYA